MIIVKKSHTNYSLLIDIDSCKVKYQTLLITYLKLIIKNAQNAKENVNLLDLKMIDYIRDEKNIKKDVLIKRWSNQKVSANV